VPAVQSINNPDAVLQLEDIIEDDNSGSSSSSDDETIESSTSQVRNEIR
jgi:hypothetical protein